MSFPRRGFEVMCYTCPWGEDQIATTRSTGVKEANSRNRIFDCASAPAGQFLRSNFVGSCILNIINFSLLAFFKLSKSLALGRPPILSTSLCLDQAADSQALSGWKPPFVSCHMSALNMALGTLWSFDPIQTGPRIQFKNSTTCSAPSPLLSARASNALMLASSHASSSKSFSTWTSSWPNKEAASTLHNTTTCSKGF